MDDRHWALFHPIAGIAVLGFVLLLTLPALRQLWSRTRLARRHRAGDSRDSNDSNASYEILPQIYESADGKATAESVAAFTDQSPRLAAWASLLLGLATSAAASVLLSLQTHKTESASWLRLVDIWADVPTWCLVLLQCASIPSQAQYDRRFLLATMGLCSSAALGTVLLVRHGFDIVLSLSRHGGDGVVFSIAVCWLAEILCALAALLSFASFPHRPDVFHEDGMVDQQHAVSRLARFLFSWNRVVFEVAHQRKLELEDLPNLDGDTRSSNVTERYLAGGGSAGGPNGRLWWQLVKAYRWPFVEQWVFTLVRSVLAMFPQYVMYQFLEGLDRYEGHDESQHGGQKSSDPRLWGWVIALCVSLVLQVWISSAQRWLTSSRLEVPLSSLIQALIFQKALRLDEAAEPGHKTVGADAKDTKDTKDKKEDGDAKPKVKTSSDTRQSVVNHMKLDSSRMMIFCTYNYWIPLAVFKLILAGSALARLLGWTAFLSGLFSALLVYPISQVLSKKYAAIQFGLMKYRDAKSHVLTEALQGMRQIKYSALERLYEKKILESRNEELHQFWRVSKWMFGLSLVISTGPILLSCVSLGVYTLTTSTHVRASVIFTSLGLFDQLDEAIGYLPLIQVYLMEAWTSCIRVEKYLNQPEKAPVALPGDAIVFEDATVRWPRAEDAHIVADSEETAESAGSTEPVVRRQPDEEQGPTDLAASTATASSPAVEETRSTLRNVNLSFPVGELSLVTGKTGAGKSLLLAAILGEVRLLSGTVRVPEPPLPSIIDSPDESTLTDANWVLPSLTAFVSQTPWIESGSLRENVLFGLPFRSRRYKRVLEASALAKDIELLADGDATEVGPKGVTLSGGQRWRVALARALYSRAGIMILDDVLSAVDAHVGRIIVDDALAGQLSRGRTRILATHHAEMCLDHASYLVKLESGRVLETQTIEPVQTLREPETTDAEDAEDAEGAAEGGPSSSGNKKGGDGIKKPDEEGRETGRVKYKVYREYLRASNSLWLWAVILLLVIVNRLIGVATTWSLKELAGSYSGSDNSSASAAGSAESGVLLSHHKFVSQATAPEMLWSVAQLPSMAGVSSLTAGGPGTGEDKYRQTAIFWVSAYVVFEVLSLLISTNTQLLILYTGLRASRVLFERMTHAILHAPLRWVDTISTGRILNRFTSDTYVVDRRLASDLGVFLSYVLVLVVIIATSVSVSPYIIIFGLLLLIVYGRIAVYYITAAREVKRINSVAYSPVFDQFSSVLTGLSTIRAFKRTEFYMNRMYRLIDNGSKASWAMQILARWMNFRMGMFGAAFVSMVAMCIIFGNISASLAGFGLTFALRYTSSLTRLLAYVTSIELGFNAAERILEYIDLDTEPETGNDAPAAWPTQGRIEVDHVTVAYAPELPAVLKDLSFVVEAGERIGVVGRTGAGKSTLAAVLFRLLEVREGSIRIDGIDISTLKLDQLRSRLAIIPQDPFLFAGTLRSNLDLDGSLDDHVLHEVLRRVHLVEDSGTAAPQTAQPGEVEADKDRASPVREEHVEEEIVRLLESTATESVVGEVAEVPEISQEGAVVSESATEVASTVQGYSSEGATTQEDTSADETDGRRAGSTVSRNKKKGKKTAGSVDETVDACENISSGNGGNSAQDFTNLDMPISTGGGNLSQGQRQLVCLARALLTRPKIVVLDEATSAVDRGTDGAIQESLRREFASSGCTVLVIAHRLSTVVDFNHILVLKEGRVAELGTPRELMERGMALDKEAETGESSGQTIETVGTEVETAAGAAEGEESGEPASVRAKDEGVFWELVKRSAEKEKLVEMVFGKQD